MAENIVDLQISYDIFDSDALAGSTALPEAGGTPGLIRKANVTLTTRSPVRSSFRQRFQYITLETSVSIRNLAFRPRFPTSDD
jgi:hypothetical protein